MGATESDTPWEVGLSYSKNPSHNKKYGTCPKNPTAGPKAYLAQPCAQVPTQFAPMSLAISGYIWLYLATLSYIRLAQAILSYLGLSLSISVYLWLSLAISGYLWLFLSSIREQVEVEESKLLLFETFWFILIFLFSRTSYRGARASKDVTKSGKSPYFFYPRPSPSP